MIDKSKFVEVWESKELGKIFGKLKTPVKISDSNMRQKYSIEKIKISSLLESIKNIGLQQLPVANGKGEIFIGGRRCKAMETDGASHITVEVRDISDKEQKMASYSENETSEKPTSDEEGRQLLEIRRAFRISQRELARRLKEPETYVRRRINVYKKIKPLLRQTDAIPYARDYPGSKVVTYGKALLLLPDWISITNKQKLIDLIESEGMTETKLRSLILATKKVEILIENVNDEKKKKELEKIVKPLLFTKELSFEEVEWFMREKIGHSQPLKEKYYELDTFSSQEEAHEYAGRFGGRCLGKVWKLELDTVGEKLAMKELAKIEKEKIREKH